MDKPLMKSIRLRFLCTTGNVGWDLLKLLKWVIDAVNAPLLLSSCCLIKCWEAGRLGLSYDTGIVISQVFKPGILCQETSNEALELAHEEPGQTSACQWCSWEGGEGQWHLL